MYLQPYFEVQTEENLGFPDDRNKISLNVIQKESLAREIIILIHPSIVFVHNAGAKLRCVLWHYHR